ncbi:MAG: DNA-binding protein [Euryarchaeota archaeon]|nr:DNA-binding protein [Euryarchaeota archaeon]
MTTYHRETAYRVFAQELRNTTIVLDRDETEKFAVQYVVTETGAKINRVFVVGTITDIEDIGQDAPYWRVRINDPTGTYVLYAGEYQPEASRALATAEIPQTLAVVGKAHVYMPEDGSTSVSIRPETVAVVDQPAYERWIFQTASQTLDRIRMLETQSPDAIGDMKPYREMIRNALGGGSE